MKQYKKTIIILSVFTMMMGVIVYAKTTKSFSYEMISAVHGSTNYSLAKKNTDVTTTANTYRLADNKTADALSYRISLHKKSAWFISFKKVGKANGKKKTTNYGTLSKDTYRIDLEVTNQDSSGTIYRCVKGSGSIIQ